MSLVVSVVLCTLTVAPTSPCPLVESVTRPVTVPPSARTSSYRPFADHDGLPIGGELSDECGTVENRSESIREAKICEMQCDPLGERDRTTIVEHAHMHLLRHGVYGVVEAAVRHRQ